jgi:hypothetical protein
LTPQTESEWRQALAAVHPDRIGSGAQFIALNDQREKWRASRPALCLYCEQPINPRSAKRGARYCSKHCSTRATGLKKRKPLTLKESPNEKKEWRFRCS